MAEPIVKILADYMMIPIVLLALWAILVRVNDRARYAIYSRILLAGLTSYFAAKVLGALYQPALKRPFELLGTEPGAAFLNNPGFPSDHALLAGFLTMTVWFVTKSRRLTLVVAGLALVVAIGRVLALVHTPLDVVGGLAVALVGGIWYVGMKTTNSPKDKK